MPKFTFSFETHSFSELFFQNFHKILYLDVSRLKNLIYFLIRQYCNNGASLMVARAAAGQMGALSRIVLLCPSLKY